jgi:CheY-like chemotaxis protein
MALLSGKGSAEGRCRRVYARPAASANAATIAGTLLAPPRRNGTVLGSETRPIRLLVAEDNAADVYLLKVALEEKGVAFTMDVLSDGAEAMARVAAPLEAEPPDLVLLDLNLPKHDGREILAAMRANPGFRDVPVAVLTSSESPRDRTDAQRLGATIYLRKPSDLDEFLRLGDVIRRLVSGEP